MAPGGKALLAGAVGVALGLFLGAALWGDRGQVVRSGIPSAALEARMARLERAIGDLSITLQGRGEAADETIRNRESGAPYGASDPTAASTAVSADPATPAAGELFRLAMRPTRVERLQEIAEQYARALSRQEHEEDLLFTSLDEFVQRLKEKYLFRTRNDIIAELGRPSSVRRETKGVALWYRFKDPRDNGVHTIFFGFSSGIVTQVGFFP